jgi:Bacterial regulatory helix-turn-helix protein, lysR family
MELRHLRYFVGVGEEQHFGRAAERLHVAQPALSRQIHDLEREMGFLLFDRLPRGVRLNAAGRLFLSDARRILQDVEEAKRRAERIALGKAGTLRIGIAMALAWDGCGVLSRIPAPPARCGASTASSAFYSSGRSRLIEFTVGETRWLQYAQMNNSIPAPILMILVGWLTALFFSFGLFAPRNGTVIASLFIAALSVSGAIFLIVELYSPYGGLIEVSSAPLRAALNQLGN